MKKRSFSLFLLLIGLLFLPAVSRVEAIPVKTPRTHLPVVTIFRDGFDDGRVPGKVYMNASLDIYYDPPKSIQVMLKTLVYFDHPYRGSRVLDYYGTVNFYTRGEKGNDIQGFVTFPVKMDEVKEMLAAGYQVTGATVSITPNPQVHKTGSPSKVTRAILATR